MAPPSEKTWLYPGVPILFSIFTCYYLLLWLLEGTKIILAWSDKIFIKNTLRETKLKRPNKHPCNFYVESPPSPQDSPSSKCTLQWQVYGCNCDAVYPIWGIFFIISVFSSTALDEGKLQMLGITHVLNAAYGTKFYHVHTGPDYYCESGIIFHGIPAIDIFTFKINRYFDKACDFIGKAVGTKKSGKLNGRIFVHCREGVSRSAALVLAYLVRDQEMQLRDAVRLVRSKREISPNEGFLQQLIDYSSILGRAWLVRTQKCF